MLVTRVIKKKHTNSSDKSKKKLFFMSLQRIKCVFETYGDSVVIKTESRDDNVPYETLYKNSAHEGHERVQNALRLGWEEEEEKKKKQMERRAEEKRKKAQQQREWLENIDHVWEKCLKKVHMPRLDEDVEKEGRETREVGNGKGGSGNGGGGDGVGGGSGNGTEDGVRSDQHGRKEEEKKKDDDSENNVYNFYPVLSRPGVWEMKKPTETELEGSKKTRHSKKMNKLETIYSYSKLNDKKQSEKTYRDRDDKKKKQEEELLTKKSGSALNVLYKEQQQIDEAKEGASVKKKSHSISWFSSFVRQQLAEEKKKQPDKPRRKGPTKKKPATQEFVRRGKRKIKHVVAMATQEEEEEDQEREEKNKKRRRKKKAV